MKFLKKLGRTLGFLELCPHGKDVSYCPLCCDEPRTSRLSSEYLEKQGSLVRVKGMTMFEGASVVSKKEQHDELGAKLTEHFAQAASSAVSDHHTEGLSVHGDVNGAWEEIPPRPTWHEIWMSMAHTLARRSIDPRLKVGALIITADSTQVLSVGYNGDVKGGTNQVISAEPGKSGTIHAEVNALIKCDFNVGKRKVMYITDSPCLDCARCIINAGVSEVVYDREYRDPAGLQLLRDHAIIVRQYSPP